MKNIHFSILIDAPKEKVWDTMLKEETYRKWTEIFSNGSHFVGNWEKGSDMQFLAPNAKGVMEGMVCHIKDNRLHEHISIEYLGIMNNGQADTTSDAVKEWVGGLENYTFKEVDGKTELMVDMNMNQEDFSAYFDEVWPIALEKIKELAETGKCKSISVGATINAPLEKVWNLWTDPKHIEQWCHASDDWEAPHAENDVRVDGKFKTVMASKDGKTSFDFEGVYTNIKTHKLIEYVMADGRRVQILFMAFPDGVKVSENFDMEYVYPAEKQQEGWQAILNNFKKYVEAQP